MKKNRILGFIFNGVFRKFRFYISFLVLALVGCWILNSHSESSRETGNKVLFPEFSSSDLNFDFLDVGKADCAVIHNQRSVVIIDGGLKTSKLSVVDYIKNEVIKNDNLKNINLMILTHPHSDHYGQLEDVVDCFAHKSRFRFLTCKSRVDSSSHRGYENLLEKLKHFGIKVEVLKPGNVIKLGGVEIEILGPIKEDLKNVNNNSVVCKIKYKGKKFLFTGDAERGEEEDLINSGQDLSADVIKIGHHGSKTSSSLKFLKAVGAKYAVISAGDHYNMVSIYPNKEVADRLNLLGVQYFVTKDLGTIRFSVSSNGDLKVPRKPDLKEAA